MKTQKQIVKELISLQLECFRKMVQFESVGIGITIFGNFELLDKALDLIGFPEDTAAQNDAAPDADLFTGEPWKNTPFRFSRTYLYNNTFFDGNRYCFKTIDEYVEWLYEEARKIHTERTERIDSSHFSQVSMN